MFHLILVLLLVLWLLGFVVVPVGRLIHGLLVLAIALVLIRALQDPKPLR